MKKPLKLLLPALILAALCLPTLAQEENAAPKENAAAGAPAKPAAKKAPAKKIHKNKKTKKKRTPPTVSEYKFSSGENMPAYKFDKHANPIIEKKKPSKKTASGKDRKTTGDKSRKTAQPDAQLKPVRPAGTKDAAAQEQQEQEEQQTQQVQLPLGGE